MRVQQTLVCLNKKCILDSELQHYDTQKVLKIIKKTEKSKRPNYLPKNGPNTTRKECLIGCRGNIVTCNVTLQFSLTRKIR